MPLETCAALRQHRLLPPDRLAVDGPFADAPSMARAFVQRGWLTPYQVNEIFLGRGPQLLLGSYVLLEKLGEGGMGGVYRCGAVAGLTAKTSTHGKPLCQPGQLHPFVRPKNLECPVLPDPVNCIRSLGLETLNVPDAPSPMLPLRC